MQARQVAAEDVKRAPEILAAARSRSDPASRRGRRDRAPGTRTRAGAPATHLDVVALRRGPPERSCMRVRQSELQLVELPGRCIEPRSRLEPSRVERFTCDQQRRRRPAPAPWPCRPASQRVALRLHSCSRRLRCLARSSSARRTSTSSAKPRASARLHGVKSLRKALESSIRAILARRLSAGTQSGRSSRPGRISGGPTRITPQARLDRCFVAPRRSSASASDLEPARHRLVKPSCVISSGK